MELGRRAYQEGWFGSIFPSRFNGIPMGHESSIPEKNFELRLFFDTNLVERPELLKAIEFLKSEPKGGSLCVISIADIATPTGPEIGFFDQRKKRLTSRQMRSAAQCFAIRELADTPILECGRSNEAKSIVSEFARISSGSTSLGRKSEAVQVLINKALDANAANGKRLENGSESCLLASLGGMPSDERHDFLNDIDMGLACKACASKLRGPLRAPRG